MTIKECKHCTNFIVGAKDTLTERCKIAIKYNDNSIITLSLMDFMCPWKEVIENDRNTLHI